MINLSVLARIVNVRQVLYTLSLDRFLYYSRNTSKPLKQRFLLCTVTPLTSMPHQAWQGRKLHNEVCNRLQGQVECSLNQCVARSAWGPRRSGFSTQACHLILIRSSFVGVCSVIPPPRAVSTSAPTSIGEFWSYGWAWECQPIPPLAPPSSAGIKSQAGPLPIALFPVELPSFFSGSLSGDGSSRAWQ